MTNSITLESSSVKLASHDIIVGLKDYRRWIRFAIFYIKRSYWRTKMGLLWPAISFSLFVLMLSLVWGNLFGRNLDIYLPHFGYGFTCWIFLNAMIAGGDQVFNANAGVIREFPLPLSFYAFAKAAKEMCFLFVHLFCMVIADIFFIHDINLNTLMVIPALLLYFIDAVLVALLFGMLTTRFRDVTQIVPNGMRAFFFFTPVLWMAADRSALGILVSANPFNHAIEIIRSPMSGRLPTLMNWSVMLSITFVLIVLLLIFFKKGTRQLRAWL